MLKNSRNVHRTQTILLGGGLYLGSLALAVGLNHVALWGLLLTLYAGMACWFFWFKNIPSPPSVLSGDDLLPHKEILELLPGLFCVCDEENRLVLWNQNFAQTFKCFPQKLAGLPALELVAPEERSELGKKTRVCIKTGQPFQMHTRLLLDGKKSAPYNLQGTLLTVSGKKYLIGNGIDISDLVQIQKALQTSKANLTRAQRLARMGSWHLDIADNVLSWSDEIYEIFGLNDKKPLTYEHFLEAVHPDDREMVDQAWQAALERKPYDLQHRILVHDKEKWVREVAQVEFDIKGNPLRGIGTIQDITERKQVEERLRQSQKMEAIGTLAGGIAHDFNNILNAILGFADLAMKKVEKGSMVEKSLLEITKAGKRATDLVAQILTFSRQTSREYRPIDICSIAKEALTLLRHSIPSNIEIISALNCSVPPVIADATETHQIFMNLCTNAYHSMRQSGGVLKVSIEGVELEEEQTRRDPNLKPGYYVRTVVSDTGQGMTKNTQARIFEPYFTTKGNQEGTGLGLSTVHGIVQQCGGAIRVYSEPGHGASFAIFLPCAPMENEMAANTPESLEILTGSERILMVDDEEPIIEFARAALTRMGYRLTTRTSPIEALKCFQKNPTAFDVLVTDQIMPHMMGSELAQQIRKLRPSIPVVVCSGFSDILRNISHQNNYHYVMKPVIAADLARAIRTVLDPTQKLSSPPPSVISQTLH